MARGKVIIRGKTRCCQGGVPPCTDVNEPGDETTKAFADINAVFSAAVDYADKRMREVGLKDQAFAVRATERDDNGDVIGVTTVSAGFGKLAIGASVAVGTVTVALMTVGGGDQAMRVTEGERLSSAEYRTELKSTCEAAENKLTLERSQNQDGLPLEKLALVLTEQLKAVDELGLKVPAELADNHTALRAATHDRITLLERASDDQAPDEQVDALLDQADVAADQMSAAYVALGVPECNQ